MTPWWWLSFADPTRPTGTQFLGATLVQGTTMVDAVMNSHMRAVNPGGEVQGMPIPEGITVPTWAQNRLLDRDACAKVDEAFKAQLC